MVAKPKAEPIEGAADAPKETPKPATVKGIEVLYNSGGRVRLYNLKDVAAFLNTQVKTALIVEEIKEL